MIPRPSFYCAVLLWALLGRPEAGTPGPASEAIADAGAIKVVSPAAIPPKPRAVTKDSSTSKTASGTKAKQPVSKDPSSKGAPVKAGSGKIPATKDSLAATPRDTVPAPLRSIGQNALKAPEKLLFDVIWGGWNFRWVHAGRATLELLPTGKSTEWEIRSLAWCNKFFQTFYPVRDTVTSLIDHRGVYPLRFDKRLHEGGYHANISATYDQAAHILSTQDTSLSIEPFTHDVLSAFYFIRTQPLKVGDSFDLAAVSGKKKYNLKVLCHGREKIRVPAGEFQTLIVEPVLKGDGLFKAKGKLTIWVTDDEFHTPVKMQSKIPVGSIKAELVSKS